MTAELGQLGNPSPCTPPGRRARRVVEESREQIAEAFGARPSEVIFTSGGTEADNLAVKGLYWARRGAARAAPGAGHRDRAPRGAGLGRSGWPSHEGAEVELAAGRRDGMVVPGRAARRDRARHPSSVALVSVMWANNEVGTVQPVARAGRGRARVRRSRSTPTRCRPPAQLPVDFAASGADALTVTGHKLGGPVGVGRAAAGPRRRRRCRCCTAAARSATSAPAPWTPPRSAAFAVAAEIVRQAAGRGGRTAGRAARRPDRARCWPPCPTRCSTARRPGRAGCRATRTSPSPAARATPCSCCSTRKGIACSTGSACTAGVAQPSHVLLAMGADEARARGSLRFSLGHTSTTARRRRPGLGHRRGSRPRPPRRRSLTQVRTCRVTVAGPRLLKPSRGGGRGRAPTASERWRTRIALTLRAVAGQDAGYRSATAIARAARPDRAG